MVAVILAIFCLLQIIQNMVSKPEEAPFAGIEAKRLAAMFAGMIGYGVMMVYLGFIISSVLYLIFFFGFGTGKENGTSIPKIILLGIGVPVLFYLVFYQIFLVPLPWVSFWRVKIIEKGLCQDKRLRPSVKHSVNKFRDPLRWINAFSSPAVLLPHPFFYGMENVFILLHRLLGAAFDGQGFPVAYFQQVKDAFHQANNHGIAG